MKRKRRIKEEKEEDEGRKTEDAEEGMSMEFRQPRRGRNGQQYIKLCSDQKEINVRQFVVAQFIRYDPLRKSWYYLNQ